MPDVGALSNQIRNKYSTGRDVGDRKANLTFVH